jgi:prepilin-type N-terminal cleavage/methylation domain-containing protein
MARQEGGYTLAELIVVILIFSIVMTLITVSFNRIVASSAQIIKAAETDIGGLIGLELLRCDLELAGFGLPWSIPSGATYSEAGSGVLVAGCRNGCPGAAAARFNDAPGAAPRAYQSGDNVGFNGSDYLVLKGTALGMSAASRSWSYLNYSSSGTVFKQSKSEVELKPGNSERVIVLKGGAQAGAATRELVTDGPGSSFSLVFNQPVPRAFRPASREEVHLVYGVAPADKNGFPLAFPFNRADYYLSRSAGVPSSCAPGTGVLYKTTLNHNGTTTNYPILDCAADLQVVFLLDANGSGEVNYHASDLSGSGYTAEVLRQQVKEIRVYILAQQGRKDPGFSYPVSDPTKAIVVGDAGLNRALATVLGSVWTEAALTESVGRDWRNYRWKVYTIVVQPKNL